MHNKSKDVKALLKPEVISVLDSLELKARLLAEGFLIGLHKSPYHGFSVEFSEHRPYYQGDSLRYIDWKLFGKTEKYYIKKFEEETNLISHIIVDVSASMNFAGEKRISKLQYSKLLAASLAYIINQQHDAVGITFFADRILSSLPPRANRTYLTEILSLIEKTQLGKDTNIAESLNAIAERTRKRSLQIIISDLLDDKDKIITALKRFKYKKSETIIFHILDPLEISFEFNNDAIFVDLETDESIVTQPYHLQLEYGKLIREFINDLKIRALNYGMEYHLITTDTPFDKALLKYFTLRNKLY